MSICVFFEGDIIELEITGFGNRKDPFGYVDRKLCFIRDCPKDIQLGEKVKAEIMIIRSKWMATRFKTKV